VWNHNVSIKKLRGEKKKMEDLISPLVFMLIIGGVSGYLAGRIFKRVTGRALAIGVFAFILIFLAYTGNLDVNFDALAANISSVVDIVATLGIITLVSSVPFAASFIAGLFVGYRRY
jgi:uncharacterized membrane protein (Fun14 family)